MSAEPEYVAETLAWCNERRAEQGKKTLKKLPKGTPSNGFSCPCGKALNAWVGFWHYEMGEDEPASLPEPVQRFVRAFDQGDLPQYEEKK